MQKILPLILFATVLVACAEGDALPTDGGRTDARVDGGDGGNSNIHCGEVQGPCCQPGRLCESGLHCGNGDRCCATPGGAPCTSSAQCCVGLQCLNQACVAPTHSGCTNPSDCAPGETCIDGTCETAPTTDSCGASGQTCCPGFVCDSGLACDGGVCGACGDDGQPCCQGANACISGSLVCIMATNTCGQLPPCGDEGTPCCTGNSCSGALKCVGGSCVVDTECGGLGDACCTHNVCDSTLICDGPSHTCVTPPSDCGQEGQMCCTTTPEGECVGSLNCEAASCSACRGPSGTCLFSSQCCNGSACRFASWGLHCCVGAGADCVNATDCCGLMACVDGMCQGGSDGGLCVDDSSCAEGFHCEIPFCRPDEEIMCVTQGETCSDEETCCTGLTCPGTTDPACCVAGEGACHASSDCCGGMLCEEGECACGEEDASCATSDGVDCCDGLTCIAGTCAPTAGCETYEGACEVQSDCCGSMSCLRPTRDSTQKECCSRVNALCFSDDACCGQMECVDNHCEARDEGETCANADECAFGDCNSAGICEG